MVPPWTMWIVPIIILVLQFSPTDSDSHDPFAQQPRILVQNGNLILKAANNHNVSLSSGTHGHVSINDVDMNNVVSSVRNGGSSQQISFSVQRWVMQFFQQWRANIDMQLSTLDENVTALSSKVNQFLGTGQETLSNRRLRRFMGKVQTLTDKVNRLTQLLTENECSSNPCRNGGTCIDGYNGYICNCPSNWEGPTCETDVNECGVFAGTSFGCQNGATCVNFQGSYRCDCPTNWHGVHCTEKHDDCSTASHQELCGYGYCVDEKRVQPGQPKYRCICDAGWRAGSGGPACTEDIDECSGNQVRCSINPLVSCYNYPGSFHCGPCPAGYNGNGITCSDINECEVNNGGCSMHPMVSCSNTVGSRSCGPCPTGYAGNGVYCSFVGICAVNRGGCHPMATCAENTAITGTYRECHCPAGYIGNGEGLNGCLASAGTSCANNPCVHGTCQMSGSSFHCSCNPGYYGTLCDRQLDPCMSTPCLNGGTCISGQGTFQCVCLESYEGPTCATQKRVCGGHLDEDNGTLKYPPEHGQEYAHGETCGWLISVNETKVINISMKNFHTEHSANCEYDFLQFYDGPSALSQMLIRFCGSGQNFMNFSSTHNQLFLWFHSDQSVAGLGFELVWNATDPVCGGVLNVSDYGAINSPGYPGKYPRNRNCSWLVQVPFGKRIQFHFATLRLEHHDNCSFDYLSVYDGASTNDPMLHQYCTTETPPPVMTSGHTALLYFHSDQSVEDSGFHITYAAVPGIQGCGGTLTAPAGTFSSPNYPDTYENLLNCEWLIRIHPNNRMLISFSDFHLESHGSCRYDSIEVYDGASETSPLLGRYCGTATPPDLMSNSHQVYIRFRTDSSVRHPGFRAQYRTICGGVHTELTGVLSSPYFPDPYPANALCLYDVRLPMGYIINVTFNGFYLESHANCQFDYLQVRDGGTEDSPEIGKYCGTTAPDNIVSTYNELYLKFATDGSEQKYGFYAEYEGVEIGCGGVMTSDRDQIRSPMHPDSYPHSVTCTWFLKAPPGFIIRLTFETFEIEHGDNCRFDYVLVQDSTGAKIGQYCGTTTPPVLTSTENKMFVKFVSDASVSKEGFVATYAFLDATASCGGTYYLESGVLRSPGFPTHYPANLRCIWTLHAENNRQFTLNVTNFNLESHYNCRFDYLEIKNGAYESSPMVGRYCGTDIPRSMTSHSNVFRFEFKTDGSQSGSGFEIYYDSTTTGCGGTLKTPQGSIVSPNYPQTYGYNADCKWLIQTSEGSRIALSIVDLDIEQHLICAYDYLEIFDGSTENSRSLSRICNNQQNHGPIYSTGNNMLLRFRSDFSESGRGFHVTYQTLCNNVLKKRRGVIESPNFPNTYPHNHNCTWTITAPFGNNITLAFSHLYMEGGASCIRDYIEILDNAGLTSLAKYCGTPENLPPMIETATHLAMVRLVTDSTVAREGFRLEYAVKGCGGDIRDRYGVITTPNFPNGYPLQTECLWHIWYPPGSRVELRITDLDMESTGDCMFDYLKVYGGEDETAPSLTKLCSKINETITLTSHGNEVVVHFFSDYSVTGKGFKAFYRKLASGCGGLFTAPRAMIMSPNYPSAYDLQADCSWLIEVDSNHLVILSFDDFHMPNAINCTQGHVSIYDGNNSSAPLLKKLCGAAKPDEVRATGHQMLIRLTSDGINVGNGFKAHYKTGCGRRLWADQDGEIVGPTDSNYLIDNEYCNWIISASDMSEKVVLLVTHLQLYPDDNCTSTVRIMDGDMPDSPMVKQLCLPHAPPPIISSGNSLHIISTAAQFRATYGVASSHCSGNFASSRGTFMSPGFPNNYPMGSECVWTISASAGSQVLVSFQSFQLEDSVHCNLDYVELHENDASGRLIGRYCGNQIPSNLTASSKIWMKFKSDGEGTEAGFMAHYEIVHGNFLNGTSGIIESPGYPHQLYGNQIYEWTVMVPYGLSVSIRFLTISIDTIHQGPACVSSVTVYDGLDDSSPELGQFCGFEIPSDPAVSIGNVVFIRYNYLNFGEWRLEWTAVNNSGIVIEEPISTDPNIPSCWQEFNLNSSSSLSFNSPNYPMEYNASINCTFIVRAPLYEHIHINFLDFELEGATSCMFDKIDIYTISNPTINEWQLNQTLCGRQNATSFQTPNNLLKIVFKTDGSVQKKGFRSILKSECGGHIFGVEGVLSTSHILPYIQSPFRGLFCEWIISVKSRRTIQLQFDSFSVPSDGICSSNYLLLRNGGQSNSPLLSSGKYCGSTIPTLPETTSNQAYVKLAFSSIGQGTPQFQLRFRELSLGCSQHYFINEVNQRVVLSSPNYPSSPTHDVECVWVIMSPPGTRMLLDFDEEFHLNPNCFGDAVEYVELRDGGTETSPLLRRVCGQTFNHPSSQMTTGNALYVTYVTTVEHPEPGFKAVIRTAECGGTIAAYSAILDSPHYPHNYSSSQECEWILKTSPGGQLILKLFELDTPDSYNCTLTDYLEIRHHDSQGEVLGLYCGRLGNGTIDIDVPGPQAYVKFKSNSAVTGQGFRLSMHRIADRCGVGLLNEPSGVITSPNYPNAAPERRECFWRIYAPEGRIVSLTFNQMNLPRDAISGNCLSYLQISTYDFNQAQEICGNDLPPAFEAMSNNVYIKFLTHGLTPGQGFQLSYSTESEAICGGLLQLPSGTIGTPPLNIINNTWLQCLWRTEPELQNQTVVFTFDVFDLPGEKANYCSGAALYLMFGKTASYNDGYYGSICGNFTNRNLIMSSSSPFTGLRLAALLNKPIGGIQGSYNVSDCGGHLDGSNATIMSPGYPNGYPPNTTCLWVLNVPYGEEIKLNTVDMRLEENCDKDFVTIRSGIRRSSPILAKFCGTHLPVPITTNSNIVSILFRSNEYGTAPGFKMTTEEVQRGCGGLIHSKRGTISSPNYPRHYGNNLECVWTIELSHGFTVNLTFVGRFDIEMENNCNKDYLLIEKYDGESWSVVAKKCGRETPPPIQSYTRTVRITFRSNSDIGGDGFQIEYKGQCGGRFKESSGTVVSPNFPHEYEDHLSCQYIIGQVGHYVHIEFDPEHFSIEFHSNCRYDYIEMFEGNTTSAPSIGRFCGTTAPAARTVLGPVLIHFFSDFIYVARGFSAHYEIIACGAVLTEPTGIISSTLSKEEEHRSDMDCKWHIIGQQNKVIALKFDFFDVQPSSRCYSDWLEIRDGNETGPIIATLCGDKVPSIVKTTGREMYLHFHSDSWWNLKGFKAGYYSTLGAQQGCGGVITTSSGEINSVDIDSNGFYESDLDCSWYIISPSADRALKLEFVKFDIEESENRSCRYDYVDVREDLGSKSALIGRFCGSNKPDPIIASGNKLTVSFHTDDKINKPGFKIKFSSVTSPCGTPTTHVTRSPQTLSSPNYPNPYPLNLRCKWNIVHNGSEDDLITISITRLDVPCSGDYLEMERSYIERQYVYSHPIRFCGPNHTREVVAKKEVYLTFHSDSIADGAHGFSLSYQLQNCNRTYTADDGVINNPGYPRSSPPGTKCMMTIISHPGKTISLYASYYMPSFNDPNCDHSRITIYDGYNTSSPLLETLCGYSYNTRTIVSTGHILHLQLLLLENEASFSIGYTTTSQGRGCGGTLTQERGMFTSPFYPQPYNVSAECSWLISVPAYHAVSIYITSFELTNSNNCETNYLEIYEGSEEALEKRVQRVCEGDYPAGHVSTGNQVLFKLVTSPTNQGAGFLVYYETVALAEEQDQSILQATPSPDAPNVQDGVLYLND